MPGSDFFSPTAKQRKAYEKISICVLTPCKDYEVPTAFARCLANMVAYSWMNGLRVYQFSHTERTVVHWARQELARRVIDHKCEYTGEQFTHLLWLDDDHVFNPDMACYLAQYADKDMVSALYYSRAGRILPVVYTREGCAPDDTDAYKHFPIIQPPDSLFECHAVGFGGLLMRRDVLDRVPQPWFSFAEAGEDIYFCVKAKQAGIRVWCDGRYKMGHIGASQIIKEQDYLKYMEEHRADMGAKIVEFKTQ